MTGRPCRVKGDSLHTLYDTGSGSRVKRFVDRQHRCLSEQRCVGQGGGGRVVGLARIGGWRGLESEVGRESGLGAGCVWSPVA